MEFLVAFSGQLNLTVCNIHQQKRSLLPCYRQNNDYYCYDKSKYQRNNSTGRASRSETGKHGSNGTDCQ